MENNIYSTTDSDENRFVDNRRSNIKSDLIEITEDKLENILLKYLKNMGRKTAWMTPLGLFISVILAINTSTFTDKFNIPANTWEAVFLIAAFGSGLWLLISLITLGIHWKNSKIDFLINEIKSTT